MFICGFVKNHDSLGMTLEIILESLKINAKISLLMETPRQFL